MYLAPCGKDLPYYEETSYLSLNKHPRLIPKSKVKLEGDQEIHTRDFDPLIFYRKVRGRLQVVSNRSDRKNQCRLISPSMRDLKQSHSNARPIMPSTCMTALSRNSLWRAVSPQSDLHESPTEVTGLEKTRLTQSSPQTETNCQASADFKKSVTSSHKTRFKWSKVKEETNGVDAGGSECLSRCHLERSESAGLLKAYRYTPDTTPRPSLVVSHLPCVDYKAASDSEGEQLPPAAPGVLTARQKDKLVEINSKQNIQRVTMSASPQRQPIVMPKATEDIHESFRPDPDTAPINQTAEATRVVVKNRLGKKRLLTVASVSIFSVGKDCMCHENPDERMRPSLLIPKAISDCDQTLGNITSGICKNLVGGVSPQRFDLHIKSQGCMGKTKTKGESEEVDTPTVTNFEKESGSEILVSKDENLTEDHFQLCPNSKTFDRYKTPDMLKRPPRKQSATSVLLTSVVKNHHKEMEAQFENQSCNTDYDANLCKNLDILTCDRNQRIHTSDLPDVPETCIGQFLENDTCVAENSVFSRMDIPQNRSKTEDSQQAYIISNVDPTQDPYRGGAKTNYPHTVRGKSKEPLLKLRSKANEGDALRDINTNQNLDHKHIRCGTIDSCERVFHDANNIHGYQCVPTKVQEDMRWQTAFETTVENQMGNCYQEQFRGPLHMPTEPFSPVGVKTPIPCSRDRKITCQIPQCNTSGSTCKGLQRNPCCVAIEEITLSRAGDTEKVMCNEGKTDKGCFEAGGSKEREKEKFQRKQAGTKSSFPLHEGTRKTSVQVGRNKNPKVVEVRNNKAAAFEHNHASYVVQSCRKNEMITASLKGPHTQGHQSQPRFYSDLKASRDTIFDETKPCDIGKTRRSALYCKNKSIAYGFVNLTQTHHNTAMNRNPIPKESKNQTGTINHHSVFEKKNHIKLSREQISKPGLVMEHSGLKNSGRDETKKTGGATRLPRSTMNRRHHAKGIKGCTRRLHRQKPPTNLPGGVIIQNKNVTRRPKYKASNPTETGKIKPHEQCCEEIDVIETYQWVPKELEEDDIKEGVSMFERRVVKQEVHRRGESSETQSSVESIGLHSKLLHPPLVSFRPPRARFKAHSSKIGDNCDHPRTNRPTVSCKTVDINFQAELQAAQARLQALHLMPPGRKGRVVIPSPETLSAAVKCLEGDSIVYTERSETGNQRTLSSYKNVDSKKERKKKCFEVPNDADKHRAQVVYNQGSHKQSITFEANSVCFEEDPLNTLGLQEKVNTTCGEISSDAKGSFSVKQYKNGLPKPRSQFRDLDTNNYTEASCQTDTVNKTTGMTTFLNKSTEELCRLFGDEHTNNRTACRSVYSSIITTDSENEDF